MKTVIGAEIRLENIKQAEQSVGSFKKMLKEAQQDVLVMADKFGIASKEATNAAMKVAQLRDKIGDAKALSDTFNPDKKFVALGGAIQGVTAGFSAFTGAMGLLGTESKQVEELLLKVQSAMALQQGLSGLKGAFDSFKLLGNAIKASTLFQKANNAATVIAATVQRAFGVSVVGTGRAFNVLKGAIVATGIGALIVGIGILIDKLGLFADKTEDAAAAQEKLAAATEKFTKAVDEQIASYDRINDLEVKRAKIAGASEATILGIQKKGIEERMALRSKEIQAAITANLDSKGLQEAYNKDIELLQNLQLDYELKQADQRRANNKSAADKLAAQQEKNRIEQTEARKAWDEASSQALKEKYQKDLEMAIEYGAYLKAEDDRLAQQAIDGMMATATQELETKKALAELALLEDPNSTPNKLLKAQADFELEMLQFEGNNIQRQVKEQEHAAAITKIKEDAAKAEEEIEKKKLEFQSYVVDQVANGLDTLAGIAGKQTAAGKVLAIASTVIKTIQGGIAAFTGMVSSIPGPVGIALGAVAAAGVVASGVKAVKQITAVKVPGASGGGAPSISLPGAPITPQAQTTNLSQGSINAVGNAANRAFVLETDVSNNQDRIRRLNRAARIN